MSFNYHKKTCDNRFSTSAKTLRRVAPKKVVLSKKLAHIDNGKSCSTGIINDDWHYNRPSKATKSDVSFSSKSTKKNSIDYCNTCGDQAHSIGHSSNSDNARSQKSTRSNKEALSKTHKGANGKRSRAEGVKLMLNGHGKVNSVKQYYKNENFQSTDSMQEAEDEFRKISLDTIKEVPEIYASSGSAINIYEVYSDSEEEVGFLDTNDVENIDNLKKFRDENYFECHSVKSRVEGKGSVTSLVDHKCVYRFYLNDRLFPVPISTDHHNNIRCVECHLPINLRDGNGEDSHKVNGTIQAKVKLSGSEAQDMILMLPVRESLIIQERRKQIRSDDEVLYFGVIKLDSFGHSVFKSTLPADSLALKYQKGYHERGSNEDCAYRGVERDDVIVI